MVSLSDLLHGRRRTLEAEHRRERVRGFRLVNRRGTVAECCPCLDPGLDIQIRRTSTACSSSCRMLWAVDHQLQSVSKRMVTTLGLTVPQRMSLLLIGRNPQITAGELAPCSTFIRGRFRESYQRLEAAKLVARAADTGDARRTQLVLTRQGREVNRRRAGTFEDAVRKTLRGDVRGRCRQRRTRPSASSGPSSCAASSMRRRQRSLRRSAARIPTPVFYAPRTLQPGFRMTV